MYPEACYNLKFSVLTKDRIQTANPLVIGQPSINHQLSHKGHNRCMSFVWSVWYIHFWTPFTWIDMQLSFSWKSVSSAVIMLDPCTWQHTFFSVWVNTAQNFWTYGIINVYILRINLSSINSSFNPFHASSGFWTSNTAYLHYLTYFLDLIMSVCWKKPLPPIQAWAQCPRWLSLVTVVYVCWVFPSSLTKWSWIMTARRRQTTRRCWRLHSTELKTSRNSSATWSPRSSTFHWNLKDHLCLLKWWDDVVGSE